MSTAYGEGEIAATAGPAVVLALSDGTTVIFTDGDNEPFDPEILREFMPGELERELFAMRLRTIAEALDNVL